MPGQVFLAKIMEKISAELDNIFKSESPLPQSYSDIGVGLIGDTNELMNVVT